jgi:hypothetical protein
VCASRADSGARSRVLLASLSTCNRVLRSPRHAKRQNHFGRVDLLALDIDKLDAIDCMSPLNHCKGIFVAVQIEFLTVNRPKSKPFGPLARALFLGNVRLVVPNTCRSLITPRVADWALSKRGRGGSSGDCERTVTTSLNVVRSRDLLRTRVIVNVTVATAPTNRLGQTEDAPEGRHRPLWPDWRCHRRLDDCQGKAHGSELPYG